MSLDDELSDLLVISLEQAVAAPYCGLLLASAGARVIKIERPEGDFARFYDSGVNGNSAIFAWLNRGKESISLNLKNNDDKNLLKKMINKADVFISNLTPGSLEKLDLDYAKVNTTNERLIFCEINGYGNSENAKSKKAYDFLSVTNPHPSTKIEQPKNIFSVSFPSYINFNKTLYIFI